MCVVSVLLEDICVRCQILFFRYASLLPFLWSCVLPGLMPCSAGCVVGLRGLVLCSVHALGARPLLLLGSRPCGRRCNLYATLCLYHAIVMCCFIYWCSPVFRMSKTMMFFSWNVCGLG